MVDGTATTVKKEKSMLKDTKEAQSWFLDKVSTAAGYRRGLLRKEDWQTGNMMIGKMYFFKYDPKWKAVLPVYDIYPLVFPIERYNDGLLCLNLHYLSTGERELFLSRLKKYAMATNITDKTRLRLSYDLIANTSKLYGLSRPCVKRYLYSHVRSKFIEIPGTEWDRAINLPTEQFVYKK